jgi:dipeptidyl aminopeptidase/acylaminoacyl peptidase
MHRAAVALSALLLLRRAAVSVPIIVSLLASPALAQKPGLAPADFYKEIGVGSVAMSPDGSMIAFVLTTTVEDENRRHREVWVQRMSDGAPEGEPLRFTSPTEESSSPSWSPDGKVLAFSSPRGDDSNSIWFIRMDARSGEAFHVEGVNAAPIWSPDGKWIAFTRAPASDDEGNGPREGWIAPDVISSTLDADRFDGRVITSTRYKRDGSLQLQNHYSVRDKSQLFVVPAAGGEPTQLTVLPFDAGGAVWSPDSELLLFTGNERQDDELNREQTGDIFAVARGGGDVRTLTVNPGTESGPAFAPDGGRILFTSTPERGALSGLMVVDINPDGNFAGTPRNILGDWDLGARGAAFTPNGESIRFSAGIGGNSHLFEIPAGGGEVRQISDGDRRLSGFSSTADASQMAYTGTDATHPAELYVSAADGSAEARLSSFNDAWLAEIDLQPAERITWTVADGTEIEGWLIKPTGFDPRLSYPMVLKIHGGPHSAYGNTWFRTFHVLSASGFFVLYPNPRGSSGYGHAFQYATRGSWGEMDQEDFLTGVDTALAAYPQIDGQRIGVSGGSYGGFFTNWLTATTDRFAAAVTSRSITNWESWYGASDAQGLTEYEFYGPPWEQRELYRRLSPISYVENVTAPTLIIHSENDYRTPIADGEQWFIALKKRGVPVEMVRYPRSSHGLSRTGEPWLLVDRLERLRTWFVHWLIEVPEGGVAERAR